MLGLSTGFFLGVLHEPIRGDLLINPLDLFPLLDSESLCLVVERDSIHSPVLSRSRWNVRGIGGVRGGKGLNKLWRDCGFLKSRCVPFR